jgi:hypothetical protein
LSLEEYKNLAAGSGLSRDGPIAQALFSSAEREAAQLPIALSGEYNADDAHPAYLTTAMQTWYRYLSAVRGPALQDVRDTFSVINIGRNQQGFLPEAERDRIERNKFGEVLKEREQYFADETVRTTAIDLKEATESYEQMKAANGGDDANEWSPTRYVIILALLAVPELRLNFESFLTFFSTVPAVAAVLVIVIALAIAFSSHIIGTVVKQWGELFGGHVGRREKMSAWRLLVLGILLFIVAMGLVYFTRSVLFSAAIERKIVLGETLSFSDYMGLIVSVGGNFLIWLIGVVIAYFAHSHIPNFGKKQRLVQRLQKTVSSMYHKRLEPRKNKATAKAQRALINLENDEHRRLRGHAEYEAARSAFEEFRKVDNQILAILEEYRGMLIRHLSGESNKSAFVYDDIDSVSDDKRVALDSSSYAQKKLRLPYA